MNVHPDLVDDTCREKRLRELTAAHDADASSWLLLELPHELARVGADEMCALADAGQRSGEDVGRDPPASGAATATAAAHTHRDLPRFPAHEHGIDGRPVSHREVLHVLAEVQPIHRAIRRGDEAVETAGGAVSDDAHSRILGRETGGMSRTSAILYRR